MERVGSRGREEGRVSGKERVGRERERGSREGG